MTGYSENMMMEQDKLLALFKEQGFERVEPPILQDCDIYLDLSGEEIRKRLFMVQSDYNHDQCLRPEYTVPICKDYLCRQKQGVQACYALGPVFRQRQGETGEFIQADLELIGRSDREAADAEILHLALEGAHVLKEAPYKILLGDMSLLRVVMDHLDVSPSLRRRILRSIVAGQGLPRTRQLTDLDRSSHSSRHRLLSALAGKDTQAVQELVEDVLAIAGISHVGGRSAHDIAQRFLSSSTPQGDDPSSEQRNILELFLHVRGDPDMAAAQMRELSIDTKIPMEKELDSFETRTGFMAARGIDVGNLTFTGAFARNFDYYTGMIFEITDPDRPEAKPLVAGGRYDDLLARLGSDIRIPAVGCAFWLDRFEHDPSRENFRQGEES